jgi:hypothetical protein
MLASENIPARRASLIAVGGRPIHQDLEHGMDWERI